MNAAAYLRVSSRAQDHATQKSAVERAAGARGDTITAWYAEKRSGKTLARPELDRLRADARAGHLRRLYVFKLDRLTRSGIRDTFEVIEELRAHGCELVSVADGFGLDGPAAEVVLAVMAWAAKMERLAINERISAARERVENEGGRWGRPHRLDADGVDRVQALRRRGRTMREIAIALKVPLSTVGRAALSQKHGTPGARPATRG
jgi:DNA invertase Pin-like site-specific DNA recombinase